MTIELAGDNAAVRKARGAFFTPNAVTHFLADWAIRSGSDRVLEPSCGDGAIVEAAVERLVELGGRTPIIAHELHESSAVDARALLARHGYPGQVLLGDFLATTAVASFDAVVGNPPYVRYQGFTGEARTAGLAAALAQGVRLSKLSSSWAPFVVHAAGYLRPEGRLALVLPAELLSSNYAQDVRDYLLGRFASVSVVLMERLVFPGVQTEALLLLAEGSGGTDRVRFAEVTDAAGLDDLAFDTLLDAAPGQRWTTALVPAEASRQLTELESSGLMAPLARWGRLSLGAVTGNNSYFTLSPGRARELGLAQADLVPISPAGSSHLRALRLTASQHARLGDEGARTLLFRPDRPSPAARAYIAAGEARGVDQAYKCRVRSPWWRTPVPDPPELLFTYMNQATPQLAANPAGLRYLNSVHGLYLTAEATDLAEVLALAALNTATGLSAEVTGRAYGGGILKMEPREAARLLVPTVATVRSHEHSLRAALPEARRLLRKGSLGEVQALVDGLLFDRPGIEADAVAAVRSAHGTLSERRRTRARSRTTSRGDS